MAGTYFLHCRELLGIAGVGIDERTIVGRKKIQR
jgi:hypothetical protein